MHSSLTTSMSAEPIVDTMFASENSEEQISDIETAMNQLIMAGSSEIINNDSMSVNSDTLLRSSPGRPNKFFASSLASFLVHRACCNLTLANYLYWYLYIECESHEEAIRKPDVRVQNMYKNVMRNLKRTLDQGKFI